MRYFLFIVIAFSLSSCFKEELPIAPFSRGEITTNQVVLGSNYAKQAYFDLGTNSIVQVQNKEVWDLAFDCSNGTAVRQNTSLTARAFITTSSNFEEVNSATVGAFRYDYPDGNEDSLAMGKWQDHGKVIIIDRGFLPNGTVLGKLKFQMIALQDDVYTFRYSKLDGTEYHEASVEKDDNYNSIGYSFTTHQAIYHEPLKAAYDLCFTSYIHIFYEPEYTPYSVVGALINPYNTSVHRDQNDLFSAFNQQALDTLSFTNAHNGIGYDWKVVDITTSQYTTLPQISYIIKDSEGFFYKLHFVDYYNNLGERGSPMFEFQLL
jgi:hypothetical protein